ncbi:hypothetical protein LY78DRAFT_320292 [Colletotrichum sublineola]|nr:hypothetical protein LY78DRAFT_320292 [Colletotrichum sublineola]
MNTVVGRFPPNRPRHYFCCGLLFPADPRACKARRSCVRRVLNICERLSPAVHPASKRHDWRPETCDGQTQKAPVMVAMSKTTHIQQRGSMPAGTRIPQFAESSFVSLALRLVIPQSCVVKSGINSCANPFLERLKSLDNGLHDRRGQVDGCFDLSQPACGRKRTINC